MDPKEKATWARAEVVEERLAQGDILKQVKKLNDARGKIVTAAEKKAELAFFQSGQITKLLDQQATSEMDPNFVWSLAQIDTKQKDLKNGKRETTTMTVYLARAPVDGMNPIVLLQNIERNRAAALRPPPQEERGAGGAGAGGGGGGGGGGGRGGAILVGGVRDGGAIKLPPNGGDAGKPKPKPKPISRSSSRRAPKKYHGKSSSSSSGYDSDSYDSDTGSDSDASSENTIYSRSSKSKGRNHRRFSFNRTPQRNQSRRREHHKKYYIEDRPTSPRRFNEVFDGGPPAMNGRVAYVPEAPRAAPAVDPVAAAYQAGKIDADAERFGLTERERYPPPPPRPMIPERMAPIVINEPPRDPRAVVSYGVRDQYDPRYPEPPLSPRYEDGWVEGRDFRQERGFRQERDFRQEREFRPRNDYVRREREAEAYMEDEPYYERRAPEPRIVPVFRDTQAHPFQQLPRRYSRPPSENSSRGW